VAFVIEGSLRIEGELLRFLAPRTIDALYRGKAFEGRAFRTHGGLYFGIPLGMGNEKPIREIPEGAIAYWPRPSAICIFLEDVRFGDNVTRLGAIHEGSVDRLRGVRDGSRVRMILGRND
jgi:hypothetical protein